MADRSVDAASQVETDFRQLRRFAGARLAADHDDLIVVNRFCNLITSFADGEFGVELGFWQSVASAISRANRASQLFFQLCDTASDAFEVGLACRIGRRRLLLAISPSVLIPPSSLSIAAVFSLKIIA